MTKYVYDKNYFKNINSEEKAYWLGFLYADGCVTRFYKNKTKELRSMSLEITLQESDLSHLEKFNFSLNSNVPIRKKIVKNKYNAYRLVINCTCLCEDLIKLGCIPNKSLTISFPEFIEEQKEYASSFIRGYFDGDGCVYYNDLDVCVKNKHYNQTKCSCSFTGNYNFLNSIKDILEKEGIKVSKVYNDKRSNACNIYIYGRENIKIFRDYIYNNSSVYLDRKYDKFLEIIKLCNKTT